MSFDIWREILLRLPAESLLRFRTVCKRWLSVIDEPCFVKAHTDNQLSATTIIIRKSNGPPLYPFYYFNFEDLNFSSNGPQKQTIPATTLTLSRTGLRSLPVSACNGLMLFVTREYESNKVNFEIRNVLTGEILKLPNPNTNFKVLGMGLGYDCVSDDYKVVVVDCNGESSTRRTHVYSLKSDSWRIVGDCPYGFKSPDIEHGVFLNGSLHWLSYDGIIIAFDFETENYRQLALPSGLETTPESMQLEALGGCLFLSYISEEDSIDRSNLESHEEIRKKQKYDIKKKRKYFDAWVINDYAAEDSWIKLFSLNKYNFRFGGNNIRSVAYMKSKKQVLLQHGNSFIWFDVGRNSIKLVEVHGFCSHTKISAQICVGSLLRLHDRCGRVVSEKTTMNRGTMRMADTELTFCVRDYDPIARRKAPASHDDCYNIDSNWFTYSCQGGEIQTASSNPGSDSFIHLDICREIFLHLPAKSLIRFRALCKSYQAIIDEPCFVRAHANNQPLANTILIKNSSGPPFYPLYSFDLDAINCTFDLRLQRISTTPLSFSHRGLSYLSASVCNGLILIPNRKLEMWNPLTNECLQLPRVEFNSDVMTTGLGYDKTNDDYKVFVVQRYFSLELKDYVYPTHVYSLKSDSWRMIENFPTKNDWFPRIGPGVSLCGALHWLSEGMSKIIALDLRTEKYSQLQWPPLRRRSSITLDEKCLEVLGGCLVMIDYVIAFDGEDDYLDVWVMKDYGAEDSWINVFSINDHVHSFGQDIRPVAFMKHESPILLQHDKGLILFDAENDCLQKPKIHGLSESLYAHAFSGSIFRLHDNCGVSGSGSLRTKRTRITKRQTEISDTELYLCVRDVPYSLTNYCRLDTNWRYVSSSDEDEED